MVLFLVWTRRRLVESPVNQMSYALFQDAVIIVALLMKMLAVTTPLSKFVLMSLWSTLVT